MLFTSYLMSNTETKERLYQKTPFKPRSQQALHFKNGSFSVTMVILPSSPGIISCFLMRTLPTTCNPTKQINIPQQKTLSSSCSLVGNCFSSSRSQENRPKAVCTFPLGFTKSFKLLVTPVERVLPWGLFVLCIEKQQLFCFLSF